MAVSPSPSPLVGSSWVTPVTAHVSVSPSASVAPLRTTGTNLWLGGQSVPGEAATAVHTGLWFSVVTAVAWLLPGTGSDWWAATPAVLVIEPPALPARAVTVNTFV